MSIIFNLLLSLASATEIDFYQNRSYAQQGDLTAMFAGNSHASLKSDSTLEKVDHTFYVQEIMPVRMQVISPEAKMDENFRIMKKSLHFNFYEKQYKRCYPPIILVVHYLPKEDYKKLDHPNDIFYSTAYYFFVCDDCETSKEEQIKTFVSLAMDAQCEQ